MSRQGDLVWVFNKFGFKVLEVFCKVIFRNGGVFFYCLQFDRGIEFFNKYFFFYLKVNEVNYFVSYGDKKVVVVEWFNGMW